MKPGTSIGIVGSGIAGMACAHLLHREHDVRLYEANAYVGGHTNTIMVEEDGARIPVDTGFMVYNEVTYPNLVRLFAGLGVATMNTSMSFSVQHVPSGLEYSGSSLNHLFAQRRNLLSPRFIGMLMQIRRFNAEAPEVLEGGQYASHTLEEYVREKGYGSDMLMKYLVPMSSAVWSTPPDRMLRFPVVTLVRFFKNHGFLGLHAQHQWKTVVGGSRMYRDALIAPFRSRISTGNPAVKVLRDTMGAEIRFADGSRARHDVVILACHADEALALLDPPAPQERRVLGQFSYQPNRATLHTDGTVMPRTPLAWSSWNYRVDLDRTGEPVASTVYYMNSLQQVSRKRDYFVSISDPGLVDPASVLAVIDYRHPLFSLGAIEAQRELPALNREGPVYFCGSYFRYGFHEDALTSAVDLCRSLEERRTRATAAEAAAA